MKYWIFIFLLYSSLTHGMEQYEQNAFEFAEEEDSSLITARFGQELSPPLSSVFPKVITGNPSAMINYNEGRYSLLKLFIMSITHSDLKNNEIESFKYRGNFLNEVKCYLFKKNDFSPLSLLDVKKQSQRYCDIVMKGNWLYLDFEVEHIKNILILGTTNTTSIEKFLQKPHKRLRRQSLS